MLIIDQFEELFTAHQDHWQERPAFFAQFDAAMRADPGLRVVLTLREDFVAALDPNAYLLTDKLRARFYMERMGVPAALEAVRQPAAAAGYPFGAGVAERLVDNLRLFRVRAGAATSWSICRAGAATSCLLSVVGELGPTACYPGDNQHGSCA